MLVRNQICAELAEYLNLSCSNEATNYFCNCNILMVSNGVYDLRPQDHPFVDKDLLFYQFESFDCGIVHIVQIGHGYPGSLSSCTSSSAGWRCSIPSLPASYRIGVREVVLSLNSSQEWKGGPSCTWWIYDVFLFLFARNARTCSRRCQYASEIYAK